MSTLPSRRSTPPLGPHALHVADAHTPGVHPLAGAASRETARTQHAITWTLAPSALRAARPDLGLPAQASALSLVWTVRAGESHAFAPKDHSADVTLMLDGKPLPFKLAPDELLAEIEHDAERSVTHIRVAGLLEATLDAPTGRTLYAHTTLLAALQLPGGTYRLKP